MFLDVSTELLLSGYGIRFRPGGQSMTPTIRDGEAVTVEPVKAADVRRGEIILYRTERGLIAHRVVSIREAGAATGKRTFYLRGDASDGCDAPVSEEQIMGKIVAVERHGRKENLSGSRRSAWFKNLRRLARLKTRFCL
jgi:hypothetical protein